MLCETALLEKPMLYITLAEEILSTFHEAYEIFESKFQRLNPNLSGSDLHAAFAKDMAYQSSGAEHWPGELGDMNREIVQILCEIWDNEEAGIHKQVRTGHEGSLRNAGAAELDIERRRRGECESVKTTLGSDRCNCMIS